MASFFSHPAFPVALKYSGLKVSKRLFVTAIFLTLLPDADVIAFKFGIPYESQWGHRGFTHSLVFAFVFGYIFTFFHQFFESKKSTVFWWTSLSLISHIAFDALTNGGLGVAAFWPLTSERFFFPWTPVEVSPIGVRGFLSMRGVTVVLNEVLWLWGPALLIGGVGRLMSKKTK